MLLIPDILNVMQKNWKVSCSLLREEQISKVVSHMKTLNCVLQAEPSSLHYYCTVMFHSCIVLPPVGHTSNH